MFERMVSIVKSSYKAIGSAKFTYDKMEEVLLDIQIVLNNRPLSYCEDEVQMPTLTRNMMIFGQVNYLLSGNPSDIEEKDLRKRAR